MYCRVKKKLPQKKKKILVMELKKNSSLEFKINFVNLRSKGQMRETINFSYLATTNFKVFLKNKKKKFRNTNLLYNEWIMVPGTNEQAQRYLCRYGNNFGCLALNYRHLWPWILNLGWKWDKVSLPTHIHFSWARL